MNEVINQMDFNKYFIYDSEPIPAEHVFELTEDVLDDFYAELPEVEGINLYFHLENELFFLLDENKIEEAAYICRLISYYTYTDLTPPHSDELALKYAEKAVELIRKDEYENWLKYLRADIRERTGE